MPSEPDSIRLTFTGVADEHNRPLAIRIRLLLKDALRQYRLRCVSVEEVHTRNVEGEPLPPAPPAKVAGAPVVGSGH